SSSSSSSSSSSLQTDGHWAWPPRGPQRARHDVLRLAGASFHSGVDAEPMRSANPAGQQLLHPKLEQAAPDWLEAAQLLTDSCRRPAARLDSSLFHQALLAMARPSAGPPGLDHLSAAIAVSSDLLRPDDMEEAADEASVATSHRLPTLRPTHLLAPAYPTDLGTPPTSLDSGRPGSVDNDTICRTEAWPLEA
ncbi:unnamed protein product, partial [Protopolystoma xenopodis]